MAETTRKRLQEYFGPFDAELSELLGRPLAWRARP
jgi:hypothetical protein